MKCAIYARVSTDHQETSITNQKEYFREYIKRHNLEIFDIYSDEAFSGTETSKRLSFQRLLQDGKNKKYDILLAKSYSRFGRNQRETLSALAELFEHGIRIIFVEDGLDSLRDKGQFGLFAWLAEQESRKLSERLQMTYQLYHKQGKIYAPAETFGYKYDSAIRNYIIDEEEAEIVKMIFDMYIQGGGRNLIANFLNKNEHTAKFKKKWHGSAILRIVDNQTYLGHLIQGKTQTIDVSVKKRADIDKNNWVIHKNNHEAIITGDVFQLAQAERKRRREVSEQWEAVRHSTAYLFSNLVKCKLCGSSCIARKRRYRSPDICYSCNEYDLRGIEACGHKRNAVNEKDLILVIKSDLKTLSAHDYKAVKGFFNEINADKQQKHDTIDIATIDNQIEEQKKRGDALLDLLAEGIIGKEQFRLQNNPIAEKINALTIQKDEALFEQNKLSDNADYEGETIKTIKELLERDVSEWTNKMLRNIINKIHVDRSSDIVEITYNFAVYTA